MLSTFRQLPQFRAPLRACLCRSVATAKHAGDLKWDLVAAVSVERLPVVTPSPIPIEKGMLSTLAVRELELSMLNDHEMRHKADLEKQERKKRGEVGEGEGDTPTVTALDMEDGWKKQAGEFEPASRLTDKEGDLRSVGRQLDRSLRLVARYQLGREEYWDLPWVVRVKGESLRDTAERAVRERCGQGLEVKVLGNAPGSFYKYKYPKWYQEEVQRQGAKVWLFKAYLMNSYLAPPVVKMGEGLLDYRWSNLEEMEKLVDKDTFRALSDMLHPED